MTGGRKWEGGKYNEQWKVYCSTQSQLTISLDTPAIHRLDLIYLNCTGGKSRRADPAARRHFRLPAERLHLSFFPTAHATLHTTPLVDHPHDRIQLHTSMSAGPALLLETPIPHHFDSTGHHHTYFAMDSTMGGGNGNASASNSAFSDEDLIASLAGFAVEGQTERDLATIKSMLLSQQQQYPAGGNQQHQQQQQFTHNSYSSSNGGVWPMQSPAATTAWSSFQWNPASGQPPPNTPTLSKSLELYGSSAQQQQEYFGGAYYSQHLNGSSGRRRDVSLERPHLLNSSRNSSRHARSSSITSSVNADDSSTTPGSSLSTGFDMDMEEELTPSMNAAGPSTRQQQPAFHQQQGSDGAANNGMEDIQEDSMRESMEDVDQQQQQHNNNHIHAPQPTSSISNLPISSSTSIFDNRTALSSSRVAESPPSSLQKQWRSNTSTPQPQSQSNSRTHPRPHSSNGFLPPTSPPQTRSRSRQQQQAAALRFTSP